MAKPFSSRSAAGKNSYGQPCGGLGFYAVMATLTGSYGETCHRIVGNAIWSLSDCVKIALKKHQEGARNVEIIDLNTRERMSVADIAALKSN